MLHNFSYTRDMFLNCAGMYCIVIGCLSCVLGIYTVYVCVLLSPRESITIHTKEPMITSYNLLNKLYKWLDLQKGCCTHNYKYLEILFWNI